MRDCSESKQQRGYCPGHKQKSRKVKAAFFLCACSIRVRAEPTRREQDCKNPHRNIDQKQPVPAGCRQHDTAQNRSKDRSQRKRKHDCGHNASHLRDPPVAGNLHRQRSKQRYKRARSKALQHTAYHQCRQPRRNSAQKRTDQEDHKTRHPAAPSSKTFFCPSHNRYRHSKSQQISSGNPLYRGFADLKCFHQRSDPDRNNRLSCKNPAVWSVEKKRKKPQRKNLRCGSFLIYRLPRYKA